MMYVRFPLSLRQVEDLLHERGVDICHETVRAWWNRFGPMFAAEIKKAARTSSILFELAVAFGRGIRADQWRTALYQRALNETRFGIAKAAKVCINRAN